MADYKTFAQPFAPTGIAVQTDEHMPEGKWPVLINLRNYRYGQLMPRRGLTDITGAPGARINGVARISNATDNADAYFAMFGQQLLYSASVTTPSFTTYSSGASGYSGNAVSMITAKPIQSNRPYVYIGDSSKQSKTTYKGAALAAVENIGIRTPVSPVDVKYAETSTQRPYWVPITQFASAAGWATDATSIAASVRVSTTTTFVHKVLYDDASGPGWCNLTLKSAHPGSTAIEPTDIGAGTLLNIGGVADVFSVHSVRRGFPATTFQSVEYDPSSTLVCVTLTAPVKDIRPDDMIETVDGGATTRQHRVLSVTYDREGLPSIRFDAGAAVLTAGHSVTGLSCVRGYHPSGTIVDGNSVGINALGVTCNGTATAISWIGGISYDLTDFAAGKPIQDDDYLHLSVRLTAPENVKEIRVLFGLGTISGYGDFNNNNYTAVFRASDIAAAIANDDTLDGGLRDGANRPTVNIIDPNSPRPSRFGGRLQDTSTGQTFQKPTPQTPTFGGGNQPTVPLQPSTSPSNTYAELFIRVKEMLRIGENRNLDWRNVGGLRIDVQHTGGVSVLLSSANFQGGGNPDITELAQPYYYRYRYRNTETGVRSAYSPPYRGGVRPRRSPIAITIPQTSASGWIASDADKIDVERWGGTILAWRYIGSTANTHAGGNTTFYDNISDYTANLNAPFSDEDVIQPWPLIGNQTSGTCTVSGTTVQVAFGTFSTSWAQGTIIDIDGYPFQIYRVITADYLEIYESAGYKTIVAWTVEEPIIESQPLPIWFGPYEGFCFAMGDAYHPGRLYHTVGNDPDSTRILNWIDVTDDPSEELMNGCVWNGRAYLWTNKRMFQLLPTFNDINLFRAVEVPSGKGLFAHYAFATGPALWWMASDGIYESYGGESRKISEELNILFEPDGRQSGGNKYNYDLLTTVDINHRDTPSSNNFRLAYYEGQLYFDYLGTDAVPHTLVYDMTYSSPQIRGWFIDSYPTSEIGTGYVANFHWGDNDASFRQLLVGGYSATNARLYYMGSSAIISAKAITPLFDAGDIRGKKEWGDATLDVEGPPSGNFTVNAYLYNESGTTIGSLLGALIGSSREELIIPVTGSGTDSAQHRMIAMEVNVDTGGALDDFFLYNYAFSYFDRPDTIKVRNTDFHDHGWPGNKLVRGIVLEASGTQTVQLIKDDGTAGATLSVAHSGRRKKEYGFTPFETVLLRLNPTGSGEWQYYGHELIFDKHAQLAPTPTPWDDMGDPGAKFVQGMLLEASTQGSNVTVQVQRDGAVQAVSPDLTVNQTLNDRIVPYSWEPFITHQARLVPQSSGNIGIDRVTWVYEPEPESTTQWETQDIALSSGYGHIREVWLSVLGTSNPQTYTLELTVDNSSITSYSPVAVSSYGARQKLRFLLAPTHKGRLFRFELTSATAFRLYLKDCEVHFKAWGSSGAYEILRPFGAEHARTGATI
jgi:hypothetical protein